MKLDKTINYTRYIFFVRFLNYVNCVRVINVEKKLNNSVPVH